MTRILCTSLALVASVFVSFPGAQSAPPGAARFVGEWVGLQSWAVANPPPNVREAQPVTLTIDVRDGRLVGVMTPFMGGSDGASFADGQVVGDALKGVGGIGAPRLAPANPNQPSRGWKGNVNINFNFVVAGGSNDELIGTADVLMGEVPWTTYKYELKKKRSRY